MTTLSGVSPEVAKAASATRSESDARQAILRKKVKLCCPKCYRADMLEVDTLARCSIDVHGRAFPYADIQCSFDVSSDVWCGECGYHGTIGELQDAYSECCSVCAADPRSIGKNDDGSRYCDDCHSEDC